MIRSLSYAVSLSVILLLLNSSNAQVKQYQCQKGSEVWEYFNKFDGIQDEEYTIKWNDETIAFYLKDDEFCYNIHAVDKTILDLLEKGQSGFIKL